VGCELGEQRQDPDAPRYSVYGVYVRLKIEKDGFECTGGDFVQPNVFRELLAMLRGVQTTGPTTADLYGDDGGVEIHFQWREEGDVLVAGQIPATTNPWEYWLRTDPLLLRKQIKTIVQFEFLIDPQRIFQPCAELEHLLEYIRSIEERESKENR